MTNREIVSRIQNTLNSQTKDTFIPRRYILSVFKSKAEYLMAQKLNDKSLFRESSLFKWINCVKMVEDDVVKCGKVEFVRCDSLMKSEKPLPKLLWSRYGPSIFMVTTIDNLHQFKVITQQEYLNLKNRSNFEKFKGTYAVVYPDNYIYIPDSNIKAINVLIYTLDERADDASDCPDCKACESYWDKEVYVADKLREAVIQETIKEIAMRLQIPKDENPNMDSNIKSQTTQ